MACVQNGYYLLPLGFMDEFFYTSLHRAIAELHADGRIYPAPDCKDGFQKWRLGNRFFEPQIEARRAASNEIHFSRQ